MRGGWQELWAYFGQSIRLGGWNGAEEEVAMLVVWHWLW